MSFPTSQDSFNNPTSSDTLDSPDHAQLHQDVNAAAKALETKMGTGASTPSVGTVLRGNGSGSEWAQVDPTTDIDTMVSATLAALLTDETGSAGGGVAVFSNAPTIVTPELTTGGSWAGSPTITTPLIAGGVAYATTFLDQNATDRDITLPQSHDFLMLERLEIGATYSFELPATSTLDVASISEPQVSPSGWSRVTDTWAYLSPTSVTVPTDATAKYTVGMFVEFVQDNTTKLFVILAITATTLSLLGLSSATVANSTITSIRYSGSRAPRGVATGIHNPYVFRATQSGATSIADNSATKVLFATEAYDYNSSYDATTSTFTAPVAGVYHFDAQVTLSTTTNGIAGSFIVSLYINTAETYRSSQGTPTTSLGMLLATDIPLSASDTVEVYCLQNSDGAVNTVTTNSRTFFNGHLVHAT